MYVFKCKFNFKFKNFIVQLKILLNGKFPLSTAITHGAQFLSPLPDGSVVYACAGKSVRLPWKYDYLKETG
jgi:hypothetical protein